MSGPTNPYYQRVFNALAGTLARAKQMVNEFALIQAGFDKIGQVSSATKYQLSCSDLTSDLQANTEAAYFRIQRALILYDVRASLLQPSSSGQIEVSIKVNGVDILTGPLVIDEGEKTSETSSVQPALSVTSIPDDAEVVIGILQPGAGAKGLIVSLLGIISVPVPTP